MFGANDQGAREAIRNVAISKAALLALLVEKGVITEADVERIQPGGALHARVAAEVDQQVAAAQEKAMKELEAKSPAMAALLKSARDGGLV